MPTLYHTATSRHIQEVAILTLIKMSQPLLLFHAMHTPQGIFNCISLVKPHSSLYSEYYSPPYIVADETGTKASTLENRAEGG